MNAGRACRGERPRARSRLAERMPGVRSEVFWRVALVQLVAVALLSVVLAVVFSHGFFVDWGWLAGPAAWLLCAWVTARVVGLAVGPTLFGRCWRGWSARSRSSSACTGSAPWSPSGCSPPGARGFPARGRRGPRARGARRAGDGRQPRDRAGDRGGAGAAKGARVAIASRSREGLEEAVAAIDGELSRLRRRRLRPRPGRGAAGRGRGGARARSTSSSPTPAGRRWAARSTTSWTSGSAPTARWCWRRGCWPARSCPECASAAGGGSSTSAPAPPASRSPGLNLSNSHRMAAVGFLKTLSREVAADGITVNTVATGRFATERLADNAGSMEAAEEAAQARRSRPRASAAPRSTATSSPSSAPTAPPTSPAR